MMVAGCIPRGFHWVLGGTVTARLRVMKAPNRPTRNCTSFAIWDTLLPAHDCHKSELATL
jgi:hypothetical protein